MAFVIDNKKMAKNTIALYVRMGITMIISFFTARITLQQLGVDDYGLNNLVGSIVSMFGFINGSMGTAVQRFYSYEIGKGNHDQLKRVFGTGLYVHIIIACITFLLAEIFAVFFLHRMNIPQERMFAAQIVFQVSIISLVLNVINVPYAALLRAREEFSKIAIVEIVQSLLRLLILFLLVHISYDKLITLSLLGFSITIFYVMSLFIMARKYEETHTAPLRDKEMIKQMVSFISFLIITVFASLAKTKGLVLLINVFFGLAINAAYAVAVQVSNMVNSFVMNFKQSMVPQLMAAYGAGDKTAMHSIINMGTKISYILMLFITLPFVFESQFLLNIWLKTPPEHSAQLVKLVMIYINISSYTYFFYQAVHATGKIRGQQIWMSSLYLFNILLVYISFKLGAGFESALYINMVISLFQCIINLFYAKKQCEYKIMHFVKELLMPSVIFTLVSVIPMWCIERTVEHSTMNSIIIIVLSFVIVAISGLAVMLNKAERKSVWNILGKKTGKQ